MIIVITSNIEKDDTFKPYGPISDNGMIVMTIHDRTDVPKNAVSFYDSDRMDIYYKEGMDIDELKEELIGDEDTADDTEYKFKSMVYAGEVINDIAEKIESIAKYDPMLILACHEPINRVLSSQLKKYFKTNSVEVVPINILSYYKIAGLPELTKVLENSLNTKFIYPDDPTSYGMAIALMLQNQR